jgi:hypothetical protein
VPAVQVAYERPSPPARTYAGTVRQRRAGAGAHGTLPSFEAKLLCLLVSHQTHPLQVMHGLQCALRQAQAHDWMQRLRPVVQHAWRALGQAPERAAQRVETSALACAGAPNLAVAGTARRRPRPRDAAPQPEHDSGKTKPPTAKHILLLNAPTGQVVYWGPTLPGQTHAKQAVDETPGADRRNTPLAKDPGLQGDEPEGVLTTPPQKSPKAKSERWGQSSATGSAPGCEWWSRT